MGDEGYYRTLKKEHVERVVGDPLGEVQFFLLPCSLLAIPPYPGLILQDVDSALLFRELRKKFNVFFIHKPYFDPSVDKKRLAKWKVQPLLTCKQIQFRSLHVRCSLLF
jgi:hypothetical protein